MVKFSFKLIPPTIDMIIEKVPDTPTDPFSRMHVVAPLPPNTLPGRPLSGTLDSAATRPSSRTYVVGAPNPSLRYGLPSGSIGKTSRWWPYPTTTPR